MIQIEVILNKYNRKMYTNVSDALPVFNLLVMRFNAEFQCKKATTRFLLFFTCFVLTKVFDEFNSIQIYMI